MQVESVRLLNAVRPRVFYVRRGRRLARRGVSTVLSILIIAIGIATLMLVVNWTYLNLARMRTQQLAESLALSAARELLDEGRLADQPLDQADDVADANDLITQPMDGLLARSNAALGPTLQVNAASDLSIVGGRVIDASQPIESSNFTTTPAPGEPLNTLRVEIHRPASGANPVQLFIRGMGSPEAATIGGSGYATLDSRLLGFRPPAFAAGLRGCPLAPLALASQAWTADRIATAVDSNGNGRFELRARLRTAGGNGDHNAALISLDTGAPLNAGQMPMQIEEGVFADDVDTTGVFGPATAADPLVTDAERNSPANVADLRDAFNAVAASPEPRRVFPLCDAYADPLDVVGFVAARVLGASLQTISGQSRLVVRIEPEFIVHPAVVTSFADATLTEVPENTYIHKLRLTR